MKRMQGVLTVGVLAIAFSGARAQDNATPSNGTSQGDNSQQQQPVPAYGQDNAPPQMSENPPISGLDEPSLEPHAAPLSYLQPGATVSESADTNIGNEPGVTSVRSVSRALGSIALQRLWGHYDLGLQYIGGVGYYNRKSLGWKVLQQLDLSQKITWKRGQLAVRDSFSYLPEGNFGSAYGSLGSQGIGSLGNTNSWAGGNLGTLGVVPRIMNTSVVDVVESLTPKSSLTAMGGYAITHFYGNDPFTGLQYINNSLISAQAGYNRQLTSRTQVALLYGYQGFDFSSIGSSFHSNLIMAMYGHRITGRMDFLLGAGPQLTNIGLACSLLNVLQQNPHCTFDQSGNPTGSIPDFRVGVAVRAKLRYQFTRTRMSLAYDRMETSGSGFFAGAQTDTARLGVERPLSRIWTGSLDLGYSRNSRLQPLTAAQQATCSPTGGGGLPVCPGVNANTYNTGFVGVALHRSFGRTLHGFASYQFDELSLDNSYCGGLPACNRIGQRHIVTIGLDWIPRPIRLD